jgi:hypothetical protein
MFVPMSSPEPPNPGASIPPPVPLPAGGPIAITGPLGIADLLDRTFRAMRARFGVLILSAALVMVPLGIVTTLISGRFVTSYMDLLQFSMDTPPEEFPAEEFFGSMAGYVGAIFLLSIISFLASTLVTLMSIHHIQRFLHGEKSTVGSSWRTAIPHLLPMIWMQIIEFVVIGAVTAVIAIVVGIVIFVFALIFGGAMAALDNEAAGVILAIGMIIVFVVGYLLLIILMVAPTVVFMGRWLAAAPTLMIEGLRPVAALRRSWALTKVRRWGSILFVALLTIFSFIVIFLPISVVQSVASLLFPAQLATIALVATALGYMLNLVYQPFYATGMILFYYDLRVRAEAYDVALRVAALEAEIVPDAPPI